MVKKAIRVNQGDLLADENGVHGEKKSRRAETSRSQSAHSSEETP